MKLKNLLSLHRVQHLNGDGKIELYLPQFNITAVQSVANKYKIVFSDHTLLTVPCSNYFRLLSKGNIFLLAMFSMEIISINYLYVTLPSVWICLQSIFQINITNISLIERN